jgi:hypothetical protein
MNVKLSDLYVGVIDFFSILLPGALLCFFAEPLAASHIFGPVLPAVNGHFEGWVIFLFAAYLVGHLVFLAASHIDELVYEWIRKGKFWSRGNSNEKKTLRDRIRGLLLSEKSDRIAAEARTITQDSFSAKQAEIFREAYSSEAPATGTETVSPFKWAKAQIVLHNPAAITEVHRLEADSKFFRSLIVVFTFITLILALAKLGIVASYEPSWLTLGACVILIILTFWRYANQRWKSTELAFIYLVAIKEAPSKDTDSEPPDNPPLHQRRQTDIITPNSWGPLSASSPASWLTPVSTPARTAKLFDAVSEGRRKCSDAFSTASHSVWGYVSLTGVAAAVVMRLS